MEDSRALTKFLAEIETPAYVCELPKLEKNLQLLKRVKEQSGCKILLALKGFAMHSTFELVSRYLDGATCSGLNEALLADELIKGEVHTYSPAFKLNEIEKIATLSDDIIFNSPTQHKAFYLHVKKINPDIKVSLRVNPQVSASPVDLYNPCAPYSRLGTTKANFDESIVHELDGLNFHALCEQNVDALELVLEAFEEQFSEYFSHLSYVNFGGGHHITREDYDVNRLIEVIQGFKSRYPHLDVYLEPGEAVGWQVGFLVSSVLDIVDNGMKIAILDTSAEAHMPDTLSMPYRAEVRRADKANVKAYTYRLGGNTCLAGDVMGDYSFDKALHVEDKIIFEDQIHYTFVKNSTFNGVALPSIISVDENYNIITQKQFNYENYRNRLS